MKITTKKRKKGQYGYLDYQHFASTLRSAAAFLIALLIFFAGFLYFGKRENIVTVLSVLTLLPACHLLVLSIMYWRFSSGSKGVFQKVKEIVPLETLVFYDSVLTLEKGGAYPVNVFVCLGSNLIGYSESEKSDPAVLEKHIKTMLRNNELSKVSIKIFNKPEAFYLRLKDLMDKYGCKEDEENLRAIALIKAISL